jgi:hypothetical protein
MVVAQQSNSCIHRSIADWKYPAVARELFPGVVTQVKDRFDDIVVMMNAWEIAPHRYALCVGSSAGSSKCAPKWRQGSVSDYNKARSNFDFTPRSGALTRAQGPATT